MKPSIFFRVSAVLLALFALGHTYGLLRFVAPTSAGVSLRKAMDAVIFHEGGRTLSYGGFYLGFGLFVTLSLLLAAAMAWWAGDLTKVAPGKARFLGSTLFVYMIGSCVLSVMYFPVPPAIFSVVIALCLSAGTALSGRETASESRAAGAKAT